MTTAGTLAGELSALGRADEAVGAAEESLVPLRRVLGADHGRFEEARELGQDTLDRQRRVLREDHRFTRVSAASPRASSVRPSPGTPPTP